MAIASLVTDAIGGLWPDAGRGKNPEMIFQLAVDKEGAIRRS